MNGLRVVILTEPEYRDLLRVVVQGTDPDNTTTGVVAQLNAARFEPVPPKMIKIYRDDQQREVARKAKART